MTHPEDVIDLRAIIDRNGLYDVITAIVELANEQTELHARTDAAKSKRWLTASTALENASYAISASL